MGEEGNLTETLLLQPNKMELVIAVAPANMGGKNHKGCGCGGKNMTKESIEFKAPEGMEVPEGINPGDTFEVMATVQLGEEGELYLKEIDGMPIGGEMEEDKGEGAEEMEMENETEGEEMPEESSNMSEGGFLDAIERRAATKNKMA